MSPIIGMDNCCDSNKQTHKLRNIQEIHCNFKTKCILVVELNASEILKNWEVGNYFLGMESTAYNSSE